MKSIPVKNRYGETYYFEQVNTDTYTLTGDYKYFRTGGLPDDNLIRSNDLGFVDHAGGPFISKGYLIDGRKVSRIYTEDNNFYFELE